MPLRSGFPGSTPLRAFQASPLGVRRRRGNVAYDLLLEDTGTLSLIVNSIDIHDATPTGFDPWDMPFVASIAVTSSLITYEGAERILSQGLGTGASGTSNYNVQSMRSGFGNTIAKTDTHTTHPGWTSQVIAQGPLVTRLLSETGNEIRIQNGMDLGIINGWQGVAWSTNVLGNRVLLYEFAWSPLSGFPLTAYSGILDLTLKLET